MVQEIDVIYEEIELPLAIQTLRELGRQFPAIGAFQYGQWE